MYDMIKQSFVIQPPYCCWSAMICPTVPKMAAIFATRIFTQKSRYVVLFFGVTSNWVRKLRLQATRNDICHGCNHFCIQVDLNLAYFIISWILLASIGFNWRKGHGSHGQWGICFHFLAWHGLTTSKSIEVAQTCGVTKASTVERSLARSWHGPKRHEHPMQQPPSSGATWPFCFAAMLMVVPVGVWKLAWLSNLPSVSNIAGAIPNDPGSRTAS